MMWKVIIAAAMVAAIVLWSGDRGKTWTVQWAKQATDLKMAMFDRDYQRLVNQIDSLAKSRDTTTGEKSEFGKFLPWLLAGASALVAYFKK